MMLRTVEFNSLSASEYEALLQRPKLDFTAIFSIVEPILNDVKHNGDKAVLTYTKRFDYADAKQVCIAVPDKESINLPAKVKQAFTTAYETIRLFHAAQQPQRIELETFPGITCIRESRPIQRVGLYIPGGTAVLPSSVLMLGVPAQLAGCREVVLATPPQKDGSIHNEVLFCAALCGIKTILCAGGAQAVAAMAYGTESVPKVDKLFGPGNQYVTAAKMLLQNSDAMVSIDMPAGPSEVLVIADASANPSFTAADLLSQAEHGSDSQVVLVAVEGFDITQLQFELEKQLNALPRKEFAQKALANSFVILVKSIDEAVEFSNAYAPEHLIIQLDNAASVIPQITQAGSVFLGHNTPESLGDYASGTNHTLPTYGYAKMYSGVSLLSFLNFITFQQATPQGLQNLGATVEIMAETEGLEAHKNAVSLRLSQLSSSTRKNV